MNLGELDCALPALCVPSGPLETNLQPLTCANTKPVPTGATVIHQATPKLTPGPQRRSSRPLGGVPPSAEGQGSPASWYSW